MHTDLKVKLQGRFMEALFDHSPLVNIKYYVAELNGYVYDSKKVYTYTVTIRHNEDEKPRELLNKAIKHWKQYNRFLDSNQQLLLDEVFMYDDIEEKTPVRVYTTPKFYNRIFTVVYPNTLIRRFKLTDSKKHIASFFRDVILTHRLGKYTNKDEVLLGDIFMIGNFMEEIL